MSYKFNPFTGTLDIVNDGIAAYYTTFLVANWVSSTPYYYIDITHNLGTTNPIISIYLGTQEVYIDHTEVLSNNLVRIFIIDSPFDGSIKII
jgi:hypothetical protein